MSGAEGEGGPPRLQPPIMQVILDLGPMADGRAGGVRNQPRAILRALRGTDLGTGRMRHGRGHDFLESCERAPAVCGLVAGQGWGREFHGKRFLRIGHNVMFSSPIFWRKKKKILKKKKKEKKNKK